MRRNLAALSVIAASLLLAQTPSQPQLVSLNILAVDSRGQNVSDLRDTDFKIEDNDKPQQIAALRANASGLATPLKAGEYSNVIRQPRGKAR